MADARKIIGKNEAKKDKKLKEANKEKNFVSPELQEIAEQLE